MVNMLIQSQPLDSKFCEQMGLNKIDENASFSEKEIKDQFIGNMFDDIPGESGKRKISLGLRFHWLFQDIKNFFYNTKYAIRNYFKWRKTIRKLRPWEGFSGLISIMITHLNDYIEAEMLYHPYHPNRCMSTIPSAEISTPSARKSVICNVRPSPSSAMLPLERITLCQGRLNFSDIE